MEDGARSSTRGNYRAVESTDSLPLQVQVLYMFDRRRRLLGILCIPLGVWSGL